MKIKNMITTTNCRRLYGYNLFLLMKCKYIRLIKHQKPKARRVIVLNDNHKGNKGT